MPLPTDPAAISTAARRYSMVVLTVVYMFNFIDRNILSILLPAIREEFQVGDAALGLLTGTAFAVFYVTLGIPIARLADRVNRRNLIAAAVAVWSGMTALSGLAVSVFQLTLARIGVGIGEAGCNPPAHSIIADLYPPEKRSAAMGVYSLGISAGIMLAWIAGGWAVQNVGWRDALFIVGIPGLLLALIVRFTMVEPVRGVTEGRSDSGRRPGFRAVLGFLLGRRSFCYMALGAGLCSLAGYSIVSFLPSFFQRSFDMPEATIGFRLGPIYGFAGGAGFFFGGYFADRIGRTGYRRSLRFIAVVILVSALCLAAVFLSTSALWCLLTYIVPAATSNFYLAPVLSQTQSLVSLRMRAVASAVLLLVVNIIGLALGPFATGLLSDSLEPAVGEESMRYSLLIVSSIMLPLGAWCFHRAGRTIDADLVRAAEQD